MCSLLTQAAVAAPTPISPITATANSEFTNDGRLASKTVGGFDFTTGLSAGTGPVDPDTGLVFPQHVSAPNNPGNLWFVWLTNNVSPGIITYDLGAVKTVDRAWIWNYNEINLTNRGAATTGTVETSLDGVNFSPLAIASNVPLTQADGFDGYDTPDVVDFGGTDAQFVRLTVTNFIPGGFTGLSEVIFFEEEIPEPSTLLLAILGLIGLASSGLRRRNRR